MPQPVQLPAGQPSTGKSMHDTAESEKEAHEQAWARQAEHNRETIEHLTSNPRGPMEDEVEKKFMRGFKPSRKD
ncbi:hypothetical protein C8A05DRAFT_38728 [Staphylotrichum tortipilum]|uniref:Uncharacterized protein n=1 Tax=Staphylotrichum tortipilum TaxID=2831512 RepID=A0AAN6MC17_9PEZI|nr:hypothetical protein C8A05DRAFT_38728 [Staphylotrichum longicolle]